MGHHPASGLTDASTVGIRQRTPCATAQAAPNPQIRQIIKSTTLFLSSRGGIPDKFSRVEEAKKRRWICVGGVFLFLLFFFYFLKNLPFPEKLFTVAGHPRQLLKNRVVEWKHLTI